MKFFITFLIIISAVLFGDGVLAQSADGIIQCGGEGQVPCNFIAFVAMINRMIKWFIAMAISIAAISFSYAGFLMLMHPDSQGERDKAKEIFRKTIIGIAVLLCSWLIVYLIVKTLSGEGTKFLIYLNA